MYTSASSVKPLPLPVMSGTPNPLDCQPVTAAEVSGEDGLAKHSASPRPAGSGVAELLPEAARRFPGKRADLGLTASPHSPQRTLDRQAGSG